MVPTCIPYEFAHTPCLPTAFPLLQLAGIGGGLAHRAYRERGYKVSRRCIRDILLGL